MLTSTSVAVVLPFWFDRPAVEALDIAVNAERFGYSELWVGEMRTFDAFALSAAIARDTRRLRLVVGPLPTATRDPAAFALGIASVAAIGARPAHVALGASTPVVVSQWHGRPWQRSVREMRETVSALRPLLAGERGRFSGEVVRCDGFRLALPPPSAEICIAAFGPQMLRAAVAIADRIVVNLLTPEQVSRVRQEIEAAARDLGKPAPPLVAWVPAALDPDGAVWSQLASQLVSYVGAPGYGEMFSAAGFAEIVQLARGGCHPRDLVAAMPQQLLEAIGAIGSLPTLHSRIAAFHSAGAATVGIVPSTANDPGGERLLEDFGRLMRRTTRIPALARRILVTACLCLYLSTPVVAGVCAYVANSGSGDVTVIETSTHTPLKTIAVGSLPRALVISPDGQQVYVANGLSRTISVITTATQTVTATFPSGRDPRALALSSDGQRLYVTNGSSDAVSILDSFDGKSLGQVPVGNGPRGIALSPDDQRAYVVTTVDDMLQVVDTEAQKVIDSVALANGPLDVAVAPDGKLLYVTDGNAVSVIHSSSDVIVLDLRIGNSPRALAVSPDGARLYALNGNSLFVIDLPGHVIDTSRLVESPHSVAVTPDSQRLYVTTANGVVVFDPTAHVVVPNVAVGADPTAVAIAEVGDGCVLQPGLCPGDCNANGTTTVDEVLALVRIALDFDPLSRCAQGDRNGDGVVAVDEVLAAVGALLDGCGAASSLDIDRPPK